MKNSTPKTKEGIVMNPNSHTRALSVLSILLCIVCACSGCAKKTEPITKTGFYFDTFITLTIYDSSQESLLDDCLSLADHYEQLFSATIEKSDVSRINQAKGEPVVVEDETIELIKKGLTYCDLSKGGFDLTIGNVSSLWNFSQNDGALPDPDRLAAAVSTVDYKNIIIENNEVRLANPDSAIDLGGIAKGYIADRMKEYLKQNGVTEGSVNLGGNVLCIGPKSDGSPYRIGIQKPFDEQGTAAAVVEVTDETVVSSGIYERFITVDGKLYHHILNPADGYPYENDLLGVTIICQDSVDGDGLSTVCFSLGLEQGMELIERLPDTEAVFITKDNKLHCSSGIGDRIPFEELQ